MTLLMFYQLKPSILNIELLPSITKFLDFLHISFYITKGGMRGQAVNTSDCGYEGFQALPMTLFPQPRNFTRNFTSCAPFPFTRTDVKGKFTYFGLLLMAGLFFTFGLSLLVCRCICCFPGLLPLPLSPHICGPS